MNCTSLEQIKLPKNLEKIGDGAFMGCNALHSITIPAKIDLFMFNSPAPFPVLPSLKEVIFENGRKEITGYGFIQSATNSDISITIPASVKKFQTDVFLINGTAAFKFL